MDAVDQVLTLRARRARQQSGPWAGLAVAALLHAALAGLVLLLPRFEKPPEPLQFVPVTVIPAQALGVERPLARKEPPAPQPPQPETRETPAPPAPVKPAPEEREPPVDRRPALPAPAPAPTPPPPQKTPPRHPEPSRTEKAPSKTPAAPPEKAKAGPSGLAAVGKGEEIGRRGSVAGSPLGTSGLGSQIAGVEDPEFTYSYYLDRLLQLIDANWSRPAMGGGVKTVLHFTIRKDGSLEDLRIQESSGYNSFDLAALRAVQNAAPFPALPASYRHDSLGVSLIVR